MFCRNCGKELPEGSKFCAGCGTPVEASAADEPEVVSEETVTPEEVVSEPVEEPKAAPATEEPAAPVATAEVPAVKEPILTGKRRGKSLLVMGVAAVAVVAVLGFLVSKLLGGGSGKGSYLYMSTDDELMFLKGLKANAETVELSNDNPNQVMFSKDGKYIYFFEGDGGYSDYQTLYRIETSKAGKDGASPEKIASDVNVYNIRILDGGKLVYLKEDQLRLFDGKESHKLKGDVDGFTLNEAKTHAYFTEYDDDGYTLNRVELKKDAQSEKLLKEADEIWSDYDADVLIYGEENEDGTYDVYSAKPGADGVKILKDVAYVYPPDEKGNFTYLTSETEEHNLYDYVTDSKAAEDQSAKEPSTSDYQREEYNTYWGYTYTTTDWDAYQAAYDVWREVRNRNNIREYLKNEDYSRTSYTLCRYEGGKETVLSEKLTNNRPDMLGQEIYLYSKSEGDNEVKKVADVSELSYGGEIYDLLDKGEYAMYQNVGGVESKWEYDEDCDLHHFGYLGDKELAMMFRDTSSDDYIVERFTIGKDKLTHVDTIIDELEGDYDFEDKAFFYWEDVSKDGDSGTLVRCDAGGKKTTIAKDVEAVHILENGTVFSFEDVDSDEWTMSSVDKEGKSAEVADDVTRVTYLDAKKFLYISDETLYLWNNGKTEEIADDVRYIWASNDLDFDSYDCG